MDSPVFLKKKITNTPTFHLVQPSTIIPFDIHPLSTIKPQSFKAKQSLSYIESTLKKYNLTLQLSSKHISEELSRQYVYLKKIYEEIVLVSRMNFTLKDQIVVSLSELLSQKQGRKKQKAKGVGRSEEGDMFLGAEEENIINSKMAPFYVRMNFLPIGRKQNQENQGVNYRNYQKYKSYREEEKQLQKTSSSLITNNDLCEKIKEDRRNRLYGSSRVTTRKASVVKSSHSSSTNPFPSSSSTSYYNSLPLSECSSLNNSKLMWNWGIKQKCKEFSSHVNSDSHMQRKSFEKVVKLVNNGYINKDIFSKDVAFKKKRKHNTKSKNIYNGKNTDIIVMQIL